MKLLEDNKTIDPNGLNEVAESTITNIKISTPTCDRYYSTSEHLAIMTYRDKFDNCLTEKAKESGAEVMDGVKVYEIKEKGDCCIAQCATGEYRALYIIGADGINGPVRRSSGLIFEFPRDQVIVAGEFELKDYGGYDAERHTMEFHFGVVPFGYGWVFPKGDALTIGLGNLVSELRGIKLKEKLYEFAEQLGIMELPKPSFNLIPLGGFKRRVATKRILLCGDAAGFVDMTAGEGTYYAIKSGILAADTLKKALEDCGSLLSYQQRCEEEILPDLRGSLKLGRWLYKNLNLFYYMVENEPQILSVFPSIASLDEPFENIYRRVLLLGVKNYIKRMFHL